MFNKKPPQANLQNIINLYGQGKLYQALTEIDQMLEQFPNSAMLYNFLGATNASLNQFFDAIENYKHAIKIKPDYAEAFNNMGIALEHQRKPEEAIESYNKAVSLMPDYAEAYYNMGNTLEGQGKSEEAIESYNKALSLMPDYAKVYINMGNVLEGQGKPEEAIVSYKKALSINPDNAETFYNMGNVLEGQGKMEEAIVSYKKALSINPDNAEACNNMGNVLEDQGKMEEAIVSYKKALSINPNDAKAFWNLSGTAENISEAKNWILRCLSADQNHLKAKLTLSAFKYYEGDKSDFNDLMQSSLKNHSYMRSFAWAFSLPKLPELFFRRWSLLDRIVEHSKKTRPFYEFGVWRGESFRYLVQTFKKGYGFDTFKGIPEDWHHEKAGKYSSDGNVPQIEGGEFIVGKFENTLPAFFSAPRPKASIINFDADLYSSTICALNYSKPVIDNDTILIFDEFLVNENWEQDEYKALNEFCSKNNLTYEVLAISFFTKQVAVKLIGI